MIEFVKSLLQKTGEELYQIALEFCKCGDYNNYCMHLTMSANFDYPEAKATIFKNGNYLFDKQDHSQTCQFYKLTSFGHKQVNFLADPITNFVNSSRNSYSLRYLGYMYRQGYGVKKNYHKAIKYYEMAIEKGNYETLTPLGHIYYYASEVQNYEKAKSLFEQAIEKKISTAFSYLGNMYEDGRGVGQNYQRARELYNLGMFYDDLNAINNLGNMYYYGLGVAVDFMKIIELYEMGCEYGNNYSYNNLAKMYYVGEGVAQNIPKAIELLKKSYDLGFTPALNNLVAIYESNNQIEPQSDITSYFLKIDKAEKLTVIYKYDSFHIELLKKNYTLEQELEKVKRTNTDMENHIKASPDGELYFAAVKDWDERKK